MSSSMKIISVIFIVLVPSLATKEYADISQLLDDPNLIIELVKRLGNDKASSPSQQKSFPVPDKHSSVEPSDPYVPVVHGDSRSCKTRLFERTIIRTEDSRKAGATFLGSAENIISNDQCLQKCCSKTGCDLAVYENKTKHNCYLFKCLDDVTGENNCKFDSHADYLSTTLSSVNDGRQSAPVLNSKAGSNEDSLGADLEKVTEQPQPVPTEPKPTPRPTQLPHSVALGRWCQLDVSCEDPHAVCFKDTCQCPQQNYYEKNGFCRKICLRDQVECERRGTARIGPDCIPKSQVCDGTTQCADGSDERDCKTASVVDKQLQPWQRKPQPRLPDGDSHSDGMGYGKNHATPDSPPDKHLSSGYRNDKEETAGRKGNNVDINTHSMASKVDSTYKSKSDGNLDDYEDYSSDVDKELEAVTVTQTDRPDVKPTFHPTKPVVSWFGEKSNNGDDQQHETSQQKETVGGSRRVHRVDTTVDESSDIGTDANSEKITKQDLTVPRGDRPEALPQPSQKVEAKMMHTPSLPDVPKAEPSQAYPKNSLQDKSSASSQSESEDRNNNADSESGYQNFHIPYSSSSQSMGREPARTQKTHSPMDVGSQDYDSNLYGLGQQRPYPMRRPIKPSWPKGNLRKYPDNSFNHPYLGGYNYDYNDYDPYPQGHDYNRPYGSHDNSRYPANSYDGGYPDGSPKPGFTPPKDTWNEKPSLPKVDSLSSSSDNSHTVDEDTSKDRTDSSAPSESGEPSGPVTNEENTQIASGNSDDKETQQTDTDKEATDNKDSNQDKDSHTAKATDREEGKTSQPTSAEVQTTPQPVKHPEVVDKAEEEEETVFVTKEKVIVASPTDNAQGPIVALSLGLAITLMLLIFVGCRLRNVRHRLRKGRPLHSNEADYLINGMYL